MTTSEAGLLDTNILVYAADETSSFHKATIGLREKGLKGEIPLCICPQVLNEFFAIVTDPRRVSNSISQREAILEIEKYFYAKNMMKIYPGRNHRANDRSSGPLRDNETRNFRLTISRNYAFQQYHPSLYL